MSMKLDARLANTGTRFKLFAQPRFIDGFGTPETIAVSIPPAMMQPGPADERLYVVDALNKRPYDPPITAPPFSGSRNPPVAPTSDGHFDHLHVDSREFSCATMYATVRRVLDIWEDFFGRRINLLGPSRLELIPLIVWDNAQSGVGFLEFGFARGAGGSIDRSRPYCQNFDVLAHELGHNIIFAEIGFPSSTASATPDFGGFHESAGDLVAIISSLHFNVVVEHLLKNTRGNLFTENELDRVGELSQSGEIRVAFNDELYSPSVTEPHDLSVPLTGAIFDILVEVFQKRLVEGGFITHELAVLSNHVPGSSEDLVAIQQKFDAAYAQNPNGFKVSLLEARDYLGHLLAATWGQLSPEFLTFNKIYRELLRADQEISAGAHGATIRDCFAWRQFPLSPLPGLQMTRNLRDCGLLNAPDASRESHVRSIERGAVWFAPAPAQVQIPGRARSKRRRSA